MNLVIDIGNTQTKWALFNQKELIHNDVINSLKEVPNIIEKVTFSEVIISSVASQEDTNFVKEIFQKPLVLDYKTPIPIENKYQSPQTLGNDRLANAVGGFLSFPHHNTLIIDAGTCLKFDFINQNKEYLGGAIAPGLNMRFKALHTFTANLPFEENIELKDFVGTNTQESIISGCANGMKNEILQTISQYETKYENLKVIFTGGDITWLENMNLSQKNSIFADRWLTLRGLNEILNYNAQK